jgi:hypothetical protein
MSMSGLSIYLQYVCSGVATGNFYGIKRGMRRNELQVSLELVVRNSFTAVELLLIISDRVPTMLRSGMPATRKISRVENLNRLQSPRIESL